MTAMTMDPGFEQRLRTPWFGAMGIDGFFNHLVMTFTGPAMG